MVPGVWDLGTSFYKTSLGGKEPERFRFGDAAIDHTQNLNQLVSTRHGLGVTDGEIQIGDANNSIIFKHELMLKNNRIICIADLNFSIRNS